MTYLVCMSMIWVATFLFLRILSIFERGEWPSEQVDGPGSALRELVLGRR